MKIKRGQVYLANLKDAQGSEQGGIRPVLVVQNNRGNKYSPTIIIACITSKAHTKHHLPTHYYIPESIGLKYPSIVMMEQIRVIDKSRIIKYIGSVSPKFMNILDKKILISLGIQQKKQMWKIKFCTLEISSYLN